MDGYVKLGYGEYEITTAEAALVVDSQIIQALGLLFMEQNKAKGSMIV